MEYSGLVTKTRAMHGGLLSQQTLAGLAECEKVEDILRFLREYGSYAPIFQSHEEIAHRAQVEAVIGDSLYSDYGKLYRFAGSTQRQGLEIIFMRYEVNVLKKCMEHIGRKIREKNLDYLNLFFGQHADFDVAAVTEAVDMTGFLAGLSGSRYEAPLRRMVENPAMSQTDYVIRMDVFYYKTAWKYKDRLKDARMREIYTQLLGTEIDWQNIMWIYRSKRFYSRRPEEIAADMIPVSYRLKKQELAELLESGTTEAFVEALGRTAYFRGRDALAAVGDEVTFARMLEKTYCLLCRKYPMSLAPVLKYLYDKENEIDKLTTILEGVRYRIPAREIRELVLAT